MIIKTGKSNKSHLLEAGRYDQSKNGRNLRPLTFFTRISAAVFSVFFLTGCFRVHYQIAEPRLPKYRLPIQTQYFLEGFIPVQEEFRFKDLCHFDQPIAIHTRIQPDNFFASLFTLGLASFRTLTVDCVREEPEVKSTRWPW